VCVIYISGGAYAFYLDEAGAQQRYEMAREAFTFSKKLNVFTATPGYPNTISWTDPNHSQYTMNWAQAVSLNIN
jgi:hypothetical protein